jgi:carbon-monoxide dehydrogenase small subunit
MTDRRPIAVTVNGVAHQREIETRLHLADFLREDLGLTGTHLGCEHGVCGACTVIVDGEPVRSCLMLAVQADGATVRTIEGIAEPDGRLHPVQEAMWERHGLQCGFCTPGVITTLVAYLEKTPDPSETDIRDVLSGNLCRCTGYQFIVDAALAAARRMRPEQ